jgi:hypothetical protein
MCAAPTAVRQDKYSFEKAVVGGITLVTMHGTLNDQFEGRKLAHSVRSKKVLVNLYDVRRFASWGMSEWMDFLRVTGECDVYLVECSTYAVSQLNLVTGLLGHAKLTSFYASYRCAACSEEMETLFVIPRDRASIPDIPATTQQCPTCGGHARLEEYPAAFFDTIAGRPAFDIDDEVLAYMRSQLHYDLSQDLTRFRAYRKTHKGYTYVRLNGNIATLAPEALARACTGTTVVDLEGAVYERTQLGPWRSFLQAAMPKTKTLQLMNLPPAFLETAVAVDDLHDRVKVRTFAMTFYCGTCDVTNAYSIDVASNLEQLAVGAVPPGRCPSCRSSLMPVTTEELVAVLRALPARDRDPDLDSFLVKARAEPLHKLDNALTFSKSSASAAPKGGKGLFVVGGLAVAVLVGGTGVAWKMWNGKEQPPPVEKVATPPPVPEAPPRPQFVRPDWITSDVPSSGYCHEKDGRLICVGVSAYRAKRDDGVTEATDAALDELVSSVGLKIPDPYFRDTIAPEYSAMRAKALSALQAATLNRTADAKAAANYSAIADAVRKARRRVVEVLQATAGVAIPAQRADWYWEEYASETDTSSEYLVFVRYDVSTDGVKALVEKYSSTMDVLGSKAMTAFPAIGWSHEGFQGGIFLAKVGDRLAKAGISGQDVIVSAGNKTVLDLSSLEHRLEAAKGDLQLAVVTGDAVPRAVTVKR